LRAAAAIAVTESDPSLTVNLDLEGPSHAQPHGGALAIAGAGAVSLLSLCF
jgi:hypothetical protein